MRFMGNPLPGQPQPPPPADPTPPALEPFAWYYCTVDAFDDAGSETDCSQDFLIRLKNCVAGWVVDAWLDGGYECTAGVELIVFTGSTAQRLVDMDGPYDTFQDCHDAHS